MKHFIHPNQLWTPKFSPDLQVSFVNAAQKEFQKEETFGRIAAGCTYFREYPNENYRLKFIMDWYKFGVDYRQLFMGYAEFEKLIRNNEAYPPYHKRPQKRDRWYYWYHPLLPFRVRNHHAHVPKKVIDEKEADRRAWRVYKKFGKDNNRKNFDLGNRKTWAKKWSNRYERQHVRLALKHGTEILPHKWFNDPRDWD